MNGKKSDTINPQHAEISDHIVGDLLLSNQSHFSAMNIRLAVESDFAAMWPIFQATVESGASYVFAPETSYEDAYAYWFTPGIRSYIAEDNGQIIGMYKMIPNQRDLGSHVANASFMVAPGYSGKGAGREMGLHCLREARKAGYLAMQFNFVVSTNKAAVALWQKLGFSIVGTLPKAFQHKSLGYVDAYVMYRFLDDIDT
jgi:L-amino acid N-acyltransferase YncA